jgi:3-keto-5-aminohexanoate cleavage enzyme
MTAESSNRPAARPGRAPGTPGASGAVMGVPGGMPGDAATLMQAVAALPAGATRSATGAGRPVRSDAKCVERAAMLASQVQQPPMTPDQARAMLGVPDRH